MILAALVWAHGPEPPIATDLPVTQIVVLTTERQMILYSGERVLKVYRIALGGNPIAPRRKGGTMKPPEGEYFVANHNPRSVCHLALHISHISPKQEAAARQKGRNPGCNIMIHGLKNGFGWVGKFHTCPI